MSDHLLLVDCSGFAYRAFHAANPSYRESDGLPTGAILGFLSMMWRMIGAARADQPTHGAAVFDAPGKTFRHKLYPKYKANRALSRAIELEPQWPYLRHAAEALGLTPVERNGFEADDVIATLAARAAKRGMRTTIVSSDKDFSQCVADGVIEIVEPMQKRRILAADVMKKFGVPPHQVPDVQALAGDAVDGIPGIPGLGLERAAALIRTHGSLEAVLANAKACRWPQVRAQLRHRKEEARLYLKLTTLKRNVPGMPDFDALKIQPIERAHLEEFVKALGAASWLDSIFSTAPKLARIVQKSADPLEWWREELAAPGQRLPEEPQCGFYKRRLVKGGAFVPARIWREAETDVMSGKPTGADLLRCEVGGKPRDPVSEWPRLAMQPIKKSEFEFETADHDHAQRYRPTDPKHDARQPINILAAAPPHNPKAKRARA